MGRSVSDLQWFIPFFPVALFGLLFAFSEYGIQLEKHRLTEIERSHVLQKTSTLRARLEGELNATLHITSGLIGYIVINPTLHNSHDVDTILATLFKQGHHLRNVGLAPDNTIGYIYPLEGNEKALGLNYTQHPQQWEAVKRAIETRSTVLAGPLQLVQGGKGLISRTPVYLDNGKYWGILSLVIDVNSLFRAAGLTGEDNEIEVALKGKDAEGHNGDMFYGRSEVFQSDPILLNLSVPGGNWQMATIPKEGWESNLDNLEYFRLAGLVIALLISSMVWMILADRKKIRHLALHDPLTGLPNRRLFDERLEYTLTHNQRYNKPFSLLYVDLDNFKPINDRYGHKVGDFVLAEVAARMKRTVRNEDTVARIGGDEFMIILPSTGNESNTRLVAEEMLQIISRPYYYQNNRLEVSTSIGISIYPINGKTVEALIRTADRAMYRAKKEGKQRINMIQGDCV